jgi:hypothetical protein
VAGALDEGLPGHRYGGCAAGTRIGQVRTDDGAWIVGYSPSNYDQLFAKQPSHVKATRNTMLISCLEVRILGGAPDLTVRMVIMSLCQYTPTWRAG